MSAEEVSERQVDGADGAGGGEGCGVTARGDGGGGVQSIPQARGLGLLGQVTLSHCNLCLGPFAVFMSVCEGSAGPKPCHLFCSV